jgi:phage gp29-like protein
MLNMIKGTGNDKLVEKALIDTYSQLGSNPSVTIPDGVDMDFMNMSSSSQNQLFEGFFDTLNAEQSKLILGQTMTTEDGSSLSQSEVHAAQQHILLNADKRYVLNFLNYKFNKFMPMFGAPEGGYFKFIESDSLSLSEQLDNDLKLQQLGVVFDEKYLREKYGIDE